MLFFAGQFALFTYMRPFLESVTGVNVKELSILLLGLGLFGLVGTFAIGNMLKKRLYSILIITPIFMSLIGVALILFGYSLPVTALMLCAWGFFATSAPVAWWTWMSRALPNEAEAGGGLMVAAIQLAITFGSSVGGLCYDTYGYQITFIASIILLASSSAMACVTWVHASKQEFTQSKELKK